MQLEQQNSPDLIPEATEGRITSARIEAAPSNMNPHHTRCGFANFHPVLTCEAREAK